MKAEVESGSVRTMKRKAWGRFTDAGFTAVRTRAVYMVQRVKSVGLFQSYG